MRTVRNVPVTGANQRTFLLDVYYPPGKPLRGRVVFSHGFKGFKDWGHWDLLGQAFADADIFVFAPKAPEGHPWSLVEASAAGLPIISTDRGAIRQNVTDGENGFLLENPEPKELAEKITLLIKDSDLREKMGAASRKLYESKFTAAAMSSQMRKVFQTVLSETCVE